MKKILLIFLSFFFLCNADFKFVNQTQNLNVQVNDSAGYVNFPDLKLCIFKNSVEPTKYQVRFSNELCSPGNMPSSYFNSIDIGDPYNNKYYDTTITLSNDKDKLNVNFEGPINNMKLDYSF